MANLDVPTWVVYLGVGLASFFCYVAVYVGKIRGNRPKQDVEIAGALVDASAIRDLTSEIRTHHAELAECREVNRDMGHHVGRKLDNVAERLKGLSDEVQQLRMEMIRRK